MFINNWFVVPGLMRREPRKVVSDINSRRPQALPPISLRDISVIMTADDHEGSIPFLWTAASSGWRDLLRTRIGEHALVLQLEVYAGEEDLVELPPPLKNVPSSCKKGWELNVFRHLEQARKISLEAMSGPQTSYSRHQRQQLAHHLAELAFAGILVPEFNAVAAAKGRADSGHFAMDYPNLYHAIRPANAVVDAVLKCAYDAQRRLLYGLPQDFNSAVSDWYAAAQPKKQDIRTMPVVHRRMGQNIEAAIRSNPDSLHLVSAGNAHLSATASGRLPLYQFINLLPGKFGIVDPSTY